MYIGEPRDRRSGNLENLDQTLFLALNASAASPVAMVALATFLSGWAIPVVLGWMVVFWIRRGEAERVALLDATVAALIALGLAQIIAVSWYHPRPAELGLGHQLLVHGKETSLPSDHAALLFGLSIPLIAHRITRSWGIVVFAIAGSVAWSRVYLGVHFPLDMLGALGVAVVGGGVTAALPVHLKRSFYGIGIYTYDWIVLRLKLPEQIFPRSKRR